MDLDYSGDIVERGSGGGALMGLLAGSALNKDRDDGRSMTWFAMVIVLIVFFIAIIFLALAFKDGRGHERKDGGNYGELLATMVAAKGFEGNNKCCDYDHDEHAEIKNQIAHSEDRRMIADTQKEISCLGKEFANIGFGLATKIDNVEKEQLKTYADIQNQLGMQNKALQQLLTKSNNSDIINGVIQQLMCGKPCLG